MDYFDKYAERMRVRGTLTATSEENRMVDAMRADWENNPSFKRVCVEGPDHKVRSVRIQTTKKTVGMDKIYVHPDDAIHSGDIILSMQDFTWLVLDTKFIGHVFQQANIVRVNRNLKWIANNVLYEQKVRVKNFSRVDGTDEYFYFTMPENTINIFLPLSEISQTLIRDIRVMVDSIPYKVTRVDNFTYIGVTVLFLTEDIRNANDTDEIADYIEPITPVPPEEIVIMGSEGIIYGFDSNYSLEQGGTKLLANWEIIDAPTWCTLTVLADSVNIKVQSNLSHIGKSIVLKATYNEVDYFKTILVKSLV